MKKSCRLLLLLLGQLAVVCACHAQGTAFTYQGRLNSSGTNLTGLYDFHVALFNVSSGAGQVGSTITNTAVGVTNGLFTVALDFGAQFPGAGRWLEVAVRTNGAASFTTLSPRQRITPTPYAITASNITGALSASQLAGTIAPANIANGTISGAMLAAGAVGSGQLAAGAVNTAALADGVVTAAKLSTVSNWYAVTFINPTPERFDVFGTALAPVGNDRVLIGAPSDSAGGISAGAAYLFGTNGHLLLTLTNPAPGNTDSFGDAVAAVGNDRLLIGEPHDDTGDFGSGVTHLYDTNGSRIVTFTNPTPAALDSFGTPVAAVGNRAVMIGARGDDTGATDAGAAYLFTTGGVLITTFTNPTPAVDDHFGATVAAVGHDRVLIGATGDSTGAPSAGAAYLFRTNGALLATFLNPAPTNYAAFGISLAVVGSDLVLIGAPDNYSGAIRAGVAYLFRTNGALLATINNPTPASGDNFGQAVAAAGNNRMLISAPRDGAIAAGTVYLFGTNGVLLATFTSPTPTSSAYLGTSVAALGNDRLLAGALYDGTGGDTSGAAYLFVMEDYSPGVIATGVRAGSITRVDLVDGLINSIKIEDGAVISTKIADGAITNAHLANNAVSSSKIADATITTADLADGAVTSNKIGGVLNASQVPGLDTAKIVSGTLDDARLSANVARRAGGNTFTGDQTLSGNAWVGNNLSAATLTSRGNLAAGSGVGTALHTIHAGTSAGTAAISGAGNKIVVENSAANGRAAFLALAGPGSSVSATRVEVQLEADVSQNRGIFGTTSAHEMQFRVNNNEVMRLWTNGNISIGNITPTNKLHVAGGVSATAFVSTSDRHAKENFAPVNTQEVLAKVAALPLTTWTFKELHDGRHLGPMAQDFYAAFGLGGSDTTITSIDPDGVALAAIQGLNQKVESERQKAEKEREQLRTENEELKARLERLERLLGEKSGGAR